MQDTKNKIEAILFTTGKFMDVDEIARLCNISSVDAVKDALKALKEDYDKNENSLEIIEEKNKCKLNIKKEYNYLTTSLLTDSEFDKPTTKSLAIIAYKNPVLQSEIIHIRGNKAYDHIKTLKEADFVTSEKKGRTRLLKLTSKFFDYFDIVESELKNKFENTALKAVVEDVEKAQKSLQNLNDKEEINQKEE
tara:strand:+ start:12131 stop:12709 length:579 start_codon:yes stop_codon:yes gene_type:complete